MSTTVDYAAPHMAGTETAIDPRHLSITTTWPSGGTHNVHLIEDADLGINVRAGKGSDGTPLRYDAERSGMVLVVLGIDENHDEVHVDARGADVDMIEALQQTVEACQRSLDALRKIQGCRI